MARVSTGSEEADALGRPIGRERGADDPLLRDRPPEPAVVRRATIVAHHEVVTGRNRDLARVVAAVTPLTGPDERLLLALAVENHASVADLEAIAGAGDDALDEVDRRLVGRRLQTDLPVRRRGAAHVVLLGPGGRVKDDDVPHVRVGEARADAVDEHPLAD